MTRNIKKIKYINLILTELFHGNHIDMKSLANTGAINVIYYGSIPFSAAEPVRLISITGCTCVETAISCQNGRSKKKCLRRREKNYHTLLPLVGFVIFNFNIRK